MHKHIESLPRPAGFCASNILPRHYGFLCVRSSLTSDDPDFHLYVDNLHRLGLSHIELPLDCIYRLLAVYHQDGSADLYVNESLPVVGEILVKRNFQAGELIRSNDIADIQRVKFEGIPLVETDGVLYCAKVRWKFGLFFDVAGNLDTEKMVLDIGRLHRRLNFEHVYASLESESLFGTLLQEGWFPFVEILGEDYKEIAKIYDSEFDVENRVREALDRFSDERVNTLLTRWLTRWPFKEKKELLEAGVYAYLKKTEEGYIQCLKTLLPELEGILRLHCAGDLGRTKPKTQELIDHAANKGEARSGPDSLLLPQHFKRYLREVIFRGFDLGTGDLELSRHSSSHGTAEAEDYTQARALQTLLAIDQIWFFLGDSTPVAE